MNPTSALTPATPVTPATSPEKNRRTFLKTMLVAGTAPLVLPSRGITAPDASPQHKIKIGLIGCGGRGTWITKLFVEHGGYEVVAGADYFQDRLDAFSTEFGVPAAKCYTGLSGYRKLIDDGGVDAVVIKSPPLLPSRPGRIRGQRRQTRLPRQTRGRGCARQSVD